MTRRTAVTATVLATILGRSMLAQDRLPSASGCASLAPSGWRTRHDPDATLCPSDPDAVPTPP